MLFLLITLKEWGPNYQISSLGSCGLKVRFMRTVKNSQNSDFNFHKTVVVGPKITVSDTKWSGKELHYWRQALFGGLLLSPSVYFYLCFSMPLCLSLSPSLSLFLGHQERSSFLYHVLLTWCTGMSQAQRNMAIGPETETSESGRWTCSFRLIDDLGIYYRWKTEQQEVHNQSTMAGPQWRLPSQVRMRSLVSSSSTRTPILSGKGSTLTTSISLVYLPEDLVSNTGTLGTRAPIHGF